MPTDSLINGIPVTVLCRTSESIHTIGTCTEIPSLVFVRLRASTNWIPFCTVYCTLPVVYCACCFSMLLYWNILQKVAVQYSTQSYCYPRTKHEEYIIRLIVSKLMIVKWVSASFLHRIVELFYLIFDIFVNCIWVDTQWQ